MLKTQHIKIDWSNKQVKGPNNRAYEKYRGTKERELYPSDPEEGQTFENELLQETDSSVLFFKENCWVTSIGFKNAWLLWDMSKKSQKEKNIGGDRKQ